ncbi:MAG: hypothetical protein AAFN12_01265 [Cyanobacteria bacterium J06560_2]
MATPAAQPIYQRYTAGSCILDVTCQPMALSRWTDRPVVEQLTFKLWLQPLDLGDVTGDPVLIAEGDRTAFREITQYFQQQTRRVLAIATLNRLSAPSPAESSAEPPASLRLQQPLGFLQLSDINAVLSECEQAVRSLPIDLQLAPSSAVSNVVSLAAARRARPSSARPRRRNTSMWASSAAAALFVVGLTTTLITKNPTLNEVSITSESAVPDSQSESSAAGNAPNDAAPQTTESLDPQAEDRSEVGATSATQSETNRPENDAPVPTRPSARGSESATAVPPNTSAPVPADSPAPSQPAPPVPESTGEAGPVEGINDSEKVPGDADSSAVTDESDAGAAAPEGSFSLPTRPARARIESASPPVASDAGNAEENEVAVDDTPAAQTESASPVSPVPEVARARPPRIFVPPADSDEPLLSPEGITAESAIPEASVSASTVDVIGRVQTYFQQRWQTDPEGSLTYRLQLSVSGEVVSFIGLDDRSQVERDRLLPTNAPPTFTLPSTTDGEPPDLVFRVVLSQDGSVEVSPF